jgi:malate synthase
LSEGPTVNADLVREIADEEMSKLKGGRFDDARKVFEEVALAKDFQPFLTLVALKHID